MWLIHKDVVIIQAKNTKYVHLKMSLWTVENTILKVN